MFRTRADLGRFLWQSVCDDATSLLVLLQLGMLHFDPNGHDPMEPVTGGGLEDDRLFRDHGPGLRQRNGDPNTACSN